MKRVLIRPNKKISVFRVTGLKILGRVGTHIFFKFFFWNKNTILSILKGEMPFKMHKIIFFSRRSKHYEPWLDCSVGGVVRSGSILFAI